MSDDAPTRFAPPTSPAGAPFWEASRERRLVLPWCDGCARPHWYPREVCPHCLAPDVSWRPSDGRGTIYAASVMPKPAMPMMASLVPYVVVLVDLDDGVRVMSNVIGCEPRAASVGRRVRAAWEPLEDGRHLLVFELDD